MILLSEREIEVWEDGKDVVLNDTYNWIRLRPAQVLEAAIRLLDWAERLKAGTWRSLEPELREAML